MPEFVINSSIFNRLMQINEEEKSKIKKSINELTKALEVYSSPEAVKIYDELFMEIKNFVSLDKEIQTEFDGTEIDKIESTLEKMLKSFKKIAPKMPLYFSKNLGKDVKQMELLLQGEESIVMKNKLLTGKVVFKNLNLVIQDYNSFFMIIDNVCNLETALAKHYLSVGNKLKAKESLGKKRLYINNSQRLLWQQLNFERITLVSRLIPAIRMIEESKKKKRISMMNIKIIKTLTKLIVAEHDRIVSLKEKYSRYKETIDLLNSYNDSYSSLVEILRKIV
ncbi:MAG: hypothetical protein ACTSP4_07320 [Candidatus Hodarchaeales archaeon]